MGIWGDKGTAAALCHLGLADGNLCQGYGGSAAFSVELYGLCVSDTLFTLHLHQVPLFRLYGLPY
jgi:hypothetical protein